MEINVDTLQPGPEMDRLIAELVMGEPEPTERHAPLHIWDRIESGQSWHCTLDYYEGDVCRWKPVEFSTNIVHAWKVVEAMRAKGIQLVIYPYLGAEKGYRVSVRDASSIWLIEMSYVTGDTAELAICRAALST